MLDHPSLYLAAFVSPDEMDSFHWKDASNSEEIAGAILSLRLFPG